MCRGVVEVPKEYFCHMDGQGSRADKFQRPELCCGSYEFVATAEYCRVRLLQADFFMYSVSYVTDFFIFLFFNICLMKKNYNLFRQVLWHCLRM